MVPVTDMDTSGPQAGWEQTIASSLEAYLSRLHSDLGALSHDKTLLEVPRAA